MLVYATMGGPADSVRTLQRRLASAIVNQVRPAQQEMVRRMQLGRVERVGFPVLRVANMASPDSAAPLVAAERAFLAGKTNEVRRLIAGTATMRTHLRPSDVTFDALYAEGWLLAAIGDSAQALRHILPGLEAIRDVPAREFQKPEIAGSLVQMMMLAAHLYGAQHDRAAQKTWAHAVLIMSDTTSSEARNARGAVWRLAR